MIFCIFMYFSPRSIFILYTLFLKSKSYHKLYSAIWNIQERIQATVNTAGAVQENKLVEIKKIYFKIWRH